MCPNLSTFRNRPGFNVLSMILYSSYKENKYFSNLKKIRPVTVVVLGHLLLCLREPLAAIYILHCVKYSVPFRVHRVNSEN